jgi:hypothetical protein
MRYLAGTVESAMPYGMVDELKFASAATHIILKKINIGFHATSPVKWLTITVVTTLSPPPDFAQGQGEKDMVNN